MLKKIKVLLVSPFFFPTNTYQQELCRKLTELYLNIEIDVLCYETTKTHVDKIGSINIFYTPCFSLLKDQFVLPNYFQLVKTLRQLKKKNDYNLVFCETRFFDSAWWLPFLARSWKVPAIIIDHCASSIKHKSPFINLFGSILDWFTTKFILNLYTKVLCSNHAVLDYLATFKVNNLDFLGTGVDTDFYNLNKGKKGSDGKIIITFASRLIYTKGVELFYEAVKLLIKEYPNIVVNIGGDGPLFKEIKSHVKIDRLGDKINVVGALSKEAMGKLLADTDIFVYPSFHHDGIPNIILEAASSEDAIITSKIGGVEEVIKDDKTGIVLNDLNAETITSAIKDLITDRDKRMNLGRESRATVTEHYRWDDVAKRMSGFMIKAVDQLQDQLQ